MSWKDKAVALYLRLGAPVKFAAKLVLGAALPGGSAVVDLIGQLLDCIHETAKDQIELDEAQAPAAAEADLKRVEEMFDVLSGDLAALTAQAAALEKMPAAAAEMVRVALATDERCRAALNKLDELARGFGRIEQGVTDVNAKADQINAKIDELLRRNNVPPGSQPQYHVSIIDEREKALLLHIKAEYRKLPAEQQRSVDLNKLGDALRGAGLAAEAKATYVEAAGATADQSAQAAAHYKEYFADLEQRHWDDALAAVLKAAALDVRLAPFPLHDYSPQRILGAGGFGAAFLCRDPHMEQDVVVKALHEADLDRSLKDVFAEAKVLLQLSRTHPAIIGVHRCGYADAAAKARPYIVLDYFCGPSLQAYLDALPSPLGLPLPDFLAVVRPIAEGMRAAHAQGVWHRDLKPDNVLVRREGDRWDVRLIDFGLAVRGRVVRSSVTRPSYERSLFGASIAGTAKYAPPEQMGELPNEKVGPYSDVYAFGKLCLYTLFKTTEPKERHWKAIPDDARDGLRAMLEKCTEHLPADRYGSFEPVVRELEALGRPKVVVPPVSDSPGDRFWAKSPSPPPVEKATPQRKPGDLYTNSIGMKFAWIPPGTFLMGSPPNEPERRDDEIQHKVTLPKGFWMGVHPVTQSQWQAVMGANPSHFKGAFLPVEQISWEEAVAFCEALGKKDGKVYRLPTEAEWEYACRAGTTSPFHFGATISTDQANYDGNYIYGAGKKGVRRQKTTPAGSFPANAWGLYDMHGNVWEWCQDWYGPRSKIDIKDPQHVANGEVRVLHGGSWSNDPKYCRSTHRAREAPGHRYYNVGCRICLCLD